MDVKHAAAEIMGGSASIRLSATSGGLPSAERTL